MSTTSTSTSFMTVFKYCLDILRDNEGLTCNKAMQNINYFIILLKIEPHFGGEINIDEYDYGELVGGEEHKRKMLELVRFSNLVNEKEASSVLANIWDDILSTHPNTKKIFLKGKGFDIKNPSSFKKIIDKLNSLELKNIEYDVLGNAYEEVIKNNMTGKELGQFFTQPAVKKMMVKLIDPKIYPDGKIETCGDPTMGTGGFLITYLQNIMQQAKDKNIKLDFDYIKNEGLYGKELQEDTYQLAVSNMLISTGHIFNKLDRGDSIREPITRKFDNILANPPFGITGLIYDDFQSSLKSEYVPIKTDNAICLFIQAIVYMLKVGGKCAVVLPAGQELMSKTNKTFINIRKYLMETCDLKEIIYLPPDIFTYTTIKTCVCLFVKKNPLSSTPPTTTVKFYNFNEKNEEKYLLIEVPIDDIVSNSYSLNYTEYIKDEKKQYEEGVVLKTLGEVCKFLSKSKRPAKYGKTHGTYPFFTSSKLKNKKYVDKPDYEEESLIIGDGGEPNINYEIKFAASDHCYVLQNKNKQKVNLKYVYYYYFYNLHAVDKLYTGIAIRNISKTDILNIKIPIPSFERQTEIVEYLNSVDEKNKQMEKEIENNKKQSQQFIKNINLKK